MKNILAVIACLLVFSSCKKTVINQPELDDQLIQGYLFADNLYATKDASGLYYIMTVEGTGVSPTLTSAVEVKYTGYLLDGTVFDQTASGKTFSSPLAGLIKGWQIGIPLMKKGGKITLIIPSALGYGSQATGPIPANSVIAFDIELIDVK
jgi:FKBP-type peptidyl-prolyl cis-trans isomerase FkpA